MLSYHRPIFSFIKFFLSSGLKGTRADAVLILEIKFSTTQSRLGYLADVLWWGGSSFWAETRDNTGSWEKRGQSLYSELDSKRTWSQTCISSLSCLSCQRYLKHISWSECYEYWICVSSPTQPSIGFKIGLSEIILSFPLLLAPVLDVGEI